MSSCKCTQCELMDPTILHTWLDLHATGRRLHAGSDIPLPQLRTTTPCHQSKPSLHSLQTSTIAIPDLSHRVLDTRLCRSTTRPIRSTSINPISQSRLSREEERYCGLKCVASEPPLINFIWPTLI